MFFHSKTSICAFSKTFIIFYFSFYTKGQFCQTYVCEDYCLHGGTPTGNWKDDHYQCHCDCPPGTSGPRCEKDACTTLSCKNGGRCVVLDTREICNCSLEYTGTPPKFDKTLQWSRNKSNFVFYFCLSLFFFNLKRGILLQK